MTRRRMARRAFAGPARCGRHSRGRLLRRSAESVWTVDGCSALIRPAATINATAAGKRMADGQIGCAGVWLGLADADKGAPLATSVSDPRISVASSGWLRDTSQRTANARRAACAAARACRGSTTSAAFVRSAAVGEAASGV